MHAVTLVLLCSILVYVMVDDLRRFRVRNEAVAALLALAVTRHMFAGGLASLAVSGLLAAVVLAMCLVAFRFGWIGGGDAKLLSAAYLWMGLDLAAAFAIAWLFGTLIYAIGAKIGVVPSRCVGGRLSMPFAPAIAGAWIVTALAGSV